MAIQRGLESARPAPERLFDDPLASRFVSPAWRIALSGARRTALRETIEALYDLIGGPGPRASAIARTRVIDDIIDQASPEQLVILGAGYDTRAFRLDALAGCAVYEVDRLATQADKRARLADLDLPAKRSPTYVAVDFAHDELVDALTAAGFSADPRTMFLWEGVTQYLAPGAVDQTLSRISRMMGRDGLLVFTYVDEAALLGHDDRFPEARRWMRGTAKRGEPWIFGLNPSDVERYLHDRGLCLLSDISTREAGDLYFPALKRRDRGSDLYRVASATVA
jgi:methyltransferase (TIGR00027 family)